MKFADLHKAIPYVKGGKQKILTMSPYPGITLAMPGRHAKDTIPIGGDFVVMVTDAGVGWNNHQFTHTDLFIDLDEKTRNEPENAAGFMGAYLDVVQGASPLKWAMFNSGPVTGIKYDTLLSAVQCLAVAEHRRYAQYENNFGGRYLPFRFSSGIVEGLWTAAHAAGKANYGARGIAQLERENGIPLLTKKLMGLDDN